MSENIILNQLPLLQEASPAKTSALPESARVWLESDQDSGLSSIEFLQSLGPDGSSLKTSLAFYRDVDVQPAKLLEESLGFMPGSESARAVSNALSALPENECLNLIRDATLPSSFKGWRKSGIARPGEFWTLNTTEWPKDAAVCSLSEVLETWEDWGRRNPDKTHQDWLDYLQKFYLSLKACRGILRRADKRGRALPPQLRQALQAVAEGEVGP